MRNNSNKFHFLKQTTLSHVNACVARAFSLALSNEEFDVPPLKRQFIANWTRHRTVYPCVMTLPSDMIPTEVFIEAVRKQPCIYDKNDTHFRNQTARGKAWIDIVNEVGGDLSSDNIDSMKMRWRSLKDCYLKHKRSINPLLSTHLNRQYKNWRWAEYLTFLDPHVTTKNSKFTLVVKKRSTKRKYDAQNIKRKEKEIKSEMLDENEGRNEKFSEVYMHQPVFDKKDDIYHLFSSYTETFRKFSPKRQVMLKMDLANLFLKAEMEHLDEIANNNMVNVQNDCYEQITGYDPESD